MDLRGRQEPTPDEARWLDLCCGALGVPADLPAEERRLLAQRALLESTNQPVDILGMGAAEAALDLVVRYGAARELDVVMLQWEQADSMTEELDTHGDEGTRRATVCARKLLDAVVCCVEVVPQQPA